jgi:hypothetical protein
LLHASFFRFQPASRHNYQLKIITMLSREVIRMENKYSSEILDVIYNQEQFTTSDLQGVVAAIVLKIYSEGKNAKAAPEQV